LRSSEIRLVNVWSDATGPGLMTEFPRSAVNDRCFLAFSSLPGFVWTLAESVFPIIGT